MFFWLLGLLGAHTARAQGSISGQVRDSVMHAPLPFASVFLANTSRGTTTDAEGRFRLADITPGHYDFGVSYVGYRLYSRPVIIAGPLVVNPEVAPAAQQLGEMLPLDYHPRRAGARTG